MCVMLILLDLIIATIYMVITRDRTARDKKTIYVYVKTGNKYRMEGMCKVKIGDEWRTAISYSSLADETVYVREIADFNNKFKPLKEWI